MAGVRAIVGAQPVPQVSRSTAPTPDPAPRMAQDSYKSRAARPQPHPAAVHMRNGIFQVLGGSVLTAGGVVGLAMTAATAPVAVPIACGVLALGGAALMAKGVHDYGRGLGELVAEVILLPIRVVNAFRPR